MLILVKIKYCIVFIPILTFMFYDFEDRIDRYELVNRHNPSVTFIDSISPLTVGNGEFAFTADVTGLQTFSDYYNNGIPLGTFSQWGWHTIPNDSNYNFHQVLKGYNNHGKIINYGSEQFSQAGKWLRANPHRLHLGKIGFGINDDELIKMEDISEVNQSINLWEGIIYSSFAYNGQNIKVKTTCHPNNDQISTTINSSFLDGGKLSIVFDFPYGTQDWGKNSTDWNSDNKHITKIINKSENSVILKRTLDATNYYVSINWKGKAEFVKNNRNKFILKIKSGDEFSFSANFNKENNFSNNQTPQEIFELSKNNWQTFWETGGAIDLSDCTDPRAFELERRIILSRYLTAVQCASSLPPAETGLTYNSWYGKFHLEMHWWHGIHFVLWDKPQLFEKSLSYYKKVMPKAIVRASSQGYTGARWPKMTAPEGFDSPSEIGVFLIWQQPHPIYYAELLYKYYRSDLILETYKDIVFNTAEFMASYPNWDNQKKRYVLGPPLIPAQEIYKPDSTLNPTFELAYWNYGLSIAQKWKERLGLERNSKWDNILEHLSELPSNNGYYQNSENGLNTFQDEKERIDHPTLLGIYGFLPTENVDKKMLTRTLKKIIESWNWQHTWGWDYPLVAMTAVRLGKPELAIDALLMDTKTNRYLLNGHNYQNENLTVYLPGNGGLLSAVAMMAAGWEGGPNISAPGFPKDGKWIVKSENLMKFQ